MVLGLFLRSSACHVLAVLVAHIAHEMAALSTLPDLQGLSSTFRAVPHHCRLSSVVEFTDIFMTGTSVHFVWEAKACVGRLQERTYQ